MRDAVVQRSRPGASAQWHDAHHAARLSEIPVPCTVYTSDIYILRSIIHRHLRLSPVSALVVSFYLLLRFSPSTINKMEWSRQGGKWALLNSRVQTNAKTPLVGPNVPYIYIREQAVRPNAHPICRLPFVPNFCGKHSELLAKIEIT